MPGIGVLPVSIGGRGEFEKLIETWVEILCIFSVIRGA